MGDRKVLWMLVSVAAVLAVVAAVTLLGGAPAPTPPPETTTVVTTTTLKGGYLNTGLSLGTLAQTMCSPFRRDLASWQGSARYRSQQVARVGRNSTAAWKLAQSGKLPSGSMSTVFASSLRDIAVNQIKAVEPTALDYVSDAERANFIRSALFACHLHHAYESTRKAVSAAQARVTHVRAIARKPQPPHLDTGFVGGPPPSSDTTPQSTPTQSSWYPAGFRPYDDNVALKWTDKCDASFSSCWGLEVFTRQGCSTLYIELQLQDSAGTAVGLSNDVLDNLQPGQLGRMSFVDTSDGESATQAQIAEVNCY